MDYKLNIGMWNKVFAVPSFIVDKYIKLARGSDLKVLLYLMNNSDKNISSEVITKELDLSEDVVEEAFSFWEQLNVIEREKAPINKSSPLKVTLIQTNANNYTNEVINTPVTEPLKAAVIKTNSCITLTPREIAARSDECDEIKFLFDYAQTIYGRCINNTEQRSIIYMHDYLGLPADVIQMVFEYGVVADKNNIRYLEKIAINWADNDITTHEQAEEEIIKYKIHHTLSEQVKSAFGLNRKLSSREQNLVNDWAEKNYDIELISYAFDKTIDSIGKLSFPYINKIINKWYAEGLTTREKIDSDDKNNKDKYSNKDHSYDIDKFDNLALNITGKQP